MIETFFRYRPKAGNFSSFQRKQVKIQIWYQKLKKVPEKISGHGLKSEKVIPLNHGLEIFLSYVNKPVEDISTVRLVRFPPSSNNLKKKATFK